MGNNFGDARVNGDQNIHGLGNELIDQDEIESQRSSFFGVNDDLDLQDTGNNGKRLGKSGAKIDQDFLRGLTGGDDAKAGRLFKNMLDLDYVDEEGNVTEAFENLPAGKMNLNAEFQGIQDEVYAKLSALVMQALESMKSSLTMNQSNIEHIREELSTQEKEMIKRSDEKKTRTEQQLKTEQDKKEIEKEEKIKSYERKIGFLPAEIKNGFLV